MLFLKKFISVTEVSLELELVLELLLNLRLK